MGGNCFPMMCTMPLSSSYVEEGYHTHHQRAICHQAPRGECLTSVFNIHCIVIEDGGVTSVARQTCAHPKIQGLMGEALAQVLIFQTELDFTRDVRFIGDSEGLRDTASKDETYGGN